MGGWEEEEEDGEERGYFGRSEGIFAIVSRWCLEHAAMYSPCPHSPCATCVFYLLCVRTVLMCWVWQSTVSLVSQSPLLLLLLPSFLLLLAM